MKELRIFDLFLNFSGGWDGVRFGGEEGWRFFNNFVLVIMNKNGIFGLDRRDC